MKTVAAFVSIICLLFLFNVYFCLAQEQRTPIYINKLIGDTLSYEECKYYSVFRNFETFNWAVFYLNPDSSLDACVNFNKNGNQVDTLLKSYTNLNSINYNIMLKFALDNPGTDTDRDGKTDLDELQKYNTDPLAAAERISEKSLSVNEGQNIIVYDKLGRELSGELLAVRPNTLLLKKAECDYDLKDFDCIWKQNYSEIDKLVIEGDSYLGLGIGIGVVASIISGAYIIYKTNDNYMKTHSAFDLIEPEEVVATGLVILAVSAGLITLGAVIGLSSSTPDVVIDSFNEDDIKGLSAYSRYPFDESEELKKIE